MNAQTLEVLEWVAAGLGLVNIALLVRRSVWNYPFGMAMVALYMFVFWEQRLYGESGLQIFFFLAQAWGWCLWLRVGSEDDRVPVRWLDGMSRAVWAVGTAAVGLNLGWIMHRFTDAVLPYADAAITTASISAQILLALRRIENWVLWIAIDVAAIMLYLNRGMYPTTVLYGAMLVMSLVGLRQWVVSARKNAQEAVPRDGVRAA